MCRVWSTCFQNIEKGISSEVFLLPSVFKLKRIVLISGYQFRSFWTPFQLLIVLRMEFVQSSQLYTGTGPDLIMKEHQRVIQNQNKLECDIKIICKDGDILYTKLLLYLMEPTLKCALIDRDDPDIKSPRVIIFPSQCINDIVNFYTDKVRIQHQPSLVEEASSGHELILQEQHDAVSNNFNDQHSQDKEGIQSSDVVETNICEKCGVGYKSLKQLKAHQWSKHKSSHLKNFKCDQCEKEFVHKFELTKHMFIHMPPTFICNTCEKAFKRRSDLVAHYKKFHEKSESFYECRECHLTFKAKYNFTRHMATKHQDAKFKCDQCNASFSRKDSYIRHLKLHN